MVAWITIGKFVDMRTRSALQQFYVATLNTEFSTWRPRQRRFTSSDEHKFHNHSDGSTNKPTVSS